MGCGTGLRGSVRGPCHALEALLHIEQLKEFYMLALTERMTEGVFQMSSEFAEGLDLLRWISKVEAVNLVRSFDRWSKYRKSHVT